VPALDESLFEAMVAIPCGVFGCSKRHPVGRTAKLTGPRQSALLLDSWQTHGSNPASSSASPHFTRLPTVYRFIMRCCNVLLDEAGGGGQPQFGRDCGHVGGDAREDCRLNRGRPPTSCLTRRSSPSGHWPTAGHPRRTRVVDAEVIRLHD
jgi:hypothetical protein